MTINIRAFFILSAVLATVYAVGFLAIPSSLASLYGVTANDGAVLAYRYFGVALLAVGLIFWFARDLHDKAALKALLMGAGIANGVGILVSIWGTASGIMNALGWTVVLIYVVLFAGCIYFLQGDTRRSIAAS